MKKIILSLSFLGLFFCIQASQICNPAITKSAPNIRFENDDINGLTKDLYTNITWARCPVGKTWDKDKKTCTGESTLFTFQEALQTASSKQGFRVANIKELLSLVEHACSKPSLNANVFLNILNKTEKENAYKGFGYIWSSTVNIKKEFMYFDTLNGNILSSEKLNHKAILLLVKEN